MQARHSMSLSSRFLQSVKNNPQVYTGILSGCIFAGALIPQTLWLSHYRRAFASYSGGQEQPLNAHVQDLADRVVDRIELAAEEEASLEFFTAYGHSPVHKGCVRLRTGAIVGIPSTFSLTSGEEVESQNLQVHGCPVDWESENGQQLKQSLLLSDRARAFAIAREIYHTRSNHVFTKGLMATGTVLLAYSTGFYTRIIFQLQSRLKSWARGGVYSLIGLAYLMLYLPSKDLYFCYQQNKADKLAAKLSVAFALGGVEYYDKCLQRNRALRQLMGEEGRNTFTVYGNESETWRVSGVPLTERRENLARFLQEHRDRIATKQKEQLSADDV